MPPRKGGRRGTVEPEGRIDLMERILKGLIQAVQDNHNNNNAEALEEPVVKVPRAESGGSYHH